MVGIIDYGMGNLQSVMNAFECVGAKASLARKPQDLDGADHVILPGVGAFAAGMENLNKSGFTGALRALAGTKPLLGICLGMQLLAEGGREGGVTNGLGLIAGEVERFDEIPGRRIPHIGWNDAKRTHPNLFFDENSDGDYYFVHSYYFKASQAEAILATCEYGEKFPCVVGNDEKRVYGVQFHPEKSHRAGLNLLKKFLELSC